MSQKWTSSSIERYVVTPFSSSKGKFQLRVAEGKTCRPTISCLLFLILTCLASGAFSQANNPSALQSQVRALTVAELSVVAERADSGDTDSQVLLGLSLGLLAERACAERVCDDKAQKAFYDSSLYWLREAAGKGGAREQYLLARADLGLPYTWDQLELDSKEASTMLRKAIAQNYAPAMTTLGHWYMEGGRYLDVDYALGMEWLNKASLAGDPEADYWIGTAYARSDQREANRWFLKGAELGNGDCQNALAVNLAEGIGAPKDVDEAVKWFRKSAEGGNSWGACNLALHYMRGEGLAKDDILSLMWGFISDGVNQGEGNYCLEEIDTGPFLKMTEEQRAEATLRANAWLNEHHYPSIESPTPAESR
jgi:TPR repeat protein